MSFSWLWVAWLALFGVIEGVALLNKKSGDTLSENVWRWFKVRDGQSMGRAIRMAALGGFLAWLAAHFLSGGAV